MKENVQVLNRFHIAALVLVFVAKFVVAVEEAEPAIFLSPRNYNPHPHEAGARGRLNSGPVVFPPNAEDNAPEEPNNVITVPRSRTSHPVDNHPYAKVARKFRYRLPGRYHNQENIANPKVYQALAKHGAKVLTQPPQELGKDHIPTTSVINADQRNYAFSYKVVDDRTGDDFSHTQSQNSKATNGEYRVKLPDGRIQIVSYTADKNGYKADVKYTENEISPQNIQIQRVPVRELKPIPAVRKGKTYDYYDDADIHSRLPLQDNNVILYVPSPSPITPEYNSYVSPSSTPLYLKQTPRISHHAPVPQPKVQIYTTNARDYNIGSYIPTTATPYYFKSIRNYQKGGVSSTIAPEIIHSGDHGIVSPGPTGQFVLTDQHGQVVATTVSPLVINNGNYGHVVQTTAAPFVLRNGDYADVIVTTVAPPTHQPYQLQNPAGRFDLVRNQHSNGFVYKKK